MIKRIIDISEPAYLHLLNRQLKIDRDGETVASLPIEDLGIVVLENPQIVLSQSLVIACQENNVALVFCNSKHLPYSLILPLSEGNTLHNKILRQQIEITKPTKNRLWQQIVVHKIKQQSRVLEWANREQKQLIRLAKKVKTGDPENIEAQAAKKYWHTLFGDDFRRNTEGEGINTLLNYGYAIIRAMMARAVVGSGLHPSIGLFHQNQYNGLCLADDLMEPLRPWVDWIVYSWIIKQDNRNIKIDQQTKSLFLCLPGEEVLYRNNRVPLMTACHYLLADLKRCFQESRSKLIYPEPINQYIMI